MPAVHPLSLARALRAVLVVALTLGLATPAVLLLDRREASAATAGDVLSEAARHAGKPYRWGATGPANFDCSGYTGYVFAQVGISLPRTSGAQRAALPQVPKDQKQPGDLIFTHDGSGRVYHVGIYAGDDMIWHSPRSGDVVKYSRIFSQSYTVGRTPLAARAPSAIDTHYRLWPAVRAGVGSPTSPEYGIRGGAARNYSNGKILWSPGTGPKAVTGAIEDRYAALGNENGPMGFPTTDEYAVGSGAKSDFQGGSIVWSPGTGAHAVHGDIGRVYARAGSQAGELGFPVSGEERVDGGVVQRFTGGTVRWEAGTRATAVALR